MTNINLKENTLSLHGKPSNVRVIKIAENIKFRVCNTCLPQKHSNFWDKFQKGEWEPWTIKIISKELPPKTTFIDLGAWIGDTSLLASSNPNCEFVIAIDPDPKAINYFEENLKINNDLSKKIELLNIAITKKIGNVFISPCDKDKPFGNSSSKIYNKKLYDRPSHKVKSKKLLDLYDEYNLSKKNVFIKIDIEGGEEDLIYSIMELLNNKETKTPIILMEVHFFWFKYFEKGINNIIKLLKKYKNIMIDEMEFKNLEEIKKYFIKNKKGTVRLFLRN